MTTKPVTRLVDLVVDRVDLVDKGAAPDADVILFKRDTSKSTQEEPVATKKETVIKREDLPKDLSEDVTKYLDQIEKAAADAAEAQTKMQADVKKFEDQIADLTEKVEKSEEDPEKVAKAEWEALPESVRKRIEEGEEAVKKAKEEAADAQKVAKEEREKREFSDLQKRAETEFSHLPGTAEEKATVLAGIEKMDEKVREQALRLFKAGDSATEEASILKALGKPGTYNQEGSAFQEITKKAQELVDAKTVPTLEQGIEKVAVDDPELYKRYMNEGSSRA